MHKSKLISLLATLKPEEYNSFSDFVASPYFNKKPELIKFVSFLQDFHPHFDQTPDLSELVKKQLLGHSTSADKKLTYLMSDLYKLLCSFLVQLERQKYNRSFLLAKSFSDRDLTKLFNKEVDSLQLELESNKIKGTDFYYSYYQLFDAKDQFFNKQNLRRDDQNVYQASRNIDLFYVAKKLKLYCNLLNRNKVLGKDSQIDDKLGIIEIAEKKLCAYPYCFSIP